jgi:hypothetical protein
MLLSVLLLLSGCATMKESFRVKHEYDLVDKAMLGFAIGGQVADYTSTKDALSRGCVEANPLFGENPNDATLIAGKLAVSTAAVWVGNNTKGALRKWSLGTMGLLGAGVALHNYNIQCN